VLYRRVMSSKRVREKMWHPRAVGHLTWKFASAVERRTSLSRRAQHAGIGDGQSIEVDDMRERTGHSLGGCRGLLAAGCTPSSVGAFVARRSAIDASTESEGVLFSAVRVLSHAGGSSPRVPGRADSQDVSQPGEFEELDDARVSDNDGEAAVGVERACSDVDH
jgi:hypothetical protein